jgi:hypothetical protein
MPRKDRYSSRFNGFTHTHPNPNPHPHPNPHPKAYIHTRSFA